MGHGASLSKAQSRPLVWHFLLPGVGEHRLQVDGANGKEPKIMLDDQPVVVERQLLLVEGDQFEIPYGTADEAPSKAQGGSHMVANDPPIVFWDASGPVRMRAYAFGHDWRDVQERQLIFSGPFGSQLLLTKDTSTRTWHLLVNGDRVEEYSSSKRSSGANDGLRDLTHMQDGSYIISPQFEASGMDLNIVSKFQFKVDSEVQEVALAHQEYIWQVVLNGTLVERKSQAKTTHNFVDSTNSGQISFELKSRSGVKLPAIIECKRVTATEVYIHTLAINGINVPASLGSMSQPTVIPVLTTDSSSQEIVEESPEPAAGLVSTHAPLIPAAPPPEILPQGVSFDFHSRLFQSSIKSKAGRFVVLGEFTTLEEAHQRYLEAIPIHCPDKKIAPTVHQEYTSEKVLGA